jgi:membrane fusion protein, multidrug efflux system
LYAIGNQMATATGTVNLRAEFPNDDEALFPNEFVNVRILVDTLKQAVTVPTPAVLSGAPGDYVYLVKDDDTVTVRKIKLGPSDGQNTAILSGLQPGETVVIDGTDRLNEGSKISIASDNPVAAAASAGSSSSSGGSSSSSGGQHHRHQKQGDSSAPSQN